MKSELSKKNEYWLPKNRYYELKYFCLQYPYWKYVCNSIDSYTKIGYSGKKNDKVSQTEIAVNYRELYLKNIKLVERVAYLTDNIISRYLLIGVTENLSYDKLIVRYRIPCCRKYYYELYRKFFYILSYSQNLQCV